MFLCWFFALMTQNYDGNGWLVKPYFTGGGTR